MSDTDRNLRRPTAAILLAAVAGIALAGCSLIPGNNVDSNIFTLVVGDCFNGDIDGEVSAVAFVECSEAHDREVFASIIMNEGEYPGLDAVVDQADAACVTQFDAFVGVRYEDSIYDFGYLYPLAESWATGDREILCVIYDPAGKIGSGSLAGAAR